MSGYLAGLLGVVLLAAVAVACVWLTDTTTVPATADDLPEQQRAMAAEWTAFVNSLPVTTEDHR